MNDFVFQSANILLPKENFEKWAVVACDQFTSQPEYWQEVEQIVGETPSTLRITLPEAYLEEGNTEERIAKVNENMLAYQTQGVLQQYDDAMILVHRTTESGTRKGLVGKIKLSDYDYRKGSTCLIRATEETVLDRIPPRVKIRKDASLELPHVLLLVDDPDNTILNAAQKGDVAYDFDMMQKGGHITGWFVDKDAQSKVQQAMADLATGENPLLFVVGDGNHSLATAKECALLNGNEDSQYALVEMVNVHDDSIQFEPIYRVLFGVDEQDLLSKLEEKLGADQGHKYTVVTPAGEREITLTANAKLPVATLQPFLDEYLKENPTVKIDYIHGEDIVRKLCKEQGTLGFIFEGMGKDQLFDAVRQDGSLPRKTFSMGHAHEKRYYIEARKIK